MQVGKDRVTLVDHPLVHRVLRDHALIAAVVRCSQAVPRATFMALMVGHLDFELHIVAEVGVLPHQELGSDRVLADSQLLMKLVLRVFCKRLLRLLLVLARCVDHLTRALT